MASATAIGAGRGGRGGRISGGWEGLGFWTVLGRARRRPVMAGSSVSPPKKQSKGEGTEVGDDMWGLNVSGWRERITAGVFWSIR